MADKFGAEDQQRCWDVCPVAGPFPLRCDQVMNGHRLHSGVVHTLDGYSQVQWETPRWPQPLTDNEGDMD